MKRVELCLTSEQDLQKVEEVVRTMQFMMPRIHLQHTIDVNSLTVHFTCYSVDVLTLSNAVLLLKNYLKKSDQVR